MKQRTLKIERAGDPVRKTEHPAIRLKGLWLLAAGLYTGERVRVTNPKPGTLILEQEITI